nr:substrate-binding domain-containing protein [Lelliottia aquatilis]
MSLSSARLRSGIASCGRDGRSSLYCSGRFHPRSRWSRAGKITRAARAPTAVFCHSDVMALGALSYAKRRGLQVPKDLSIIGFDNISLSEFCDPPLSTVSQPRYEIGREAMLLLLDQLHGQVVSSGSRLLDCELIVRGSTQALT